MSSKIRNFTPHVVSVILSDKRISFASEGVARVSTDTVPMGAIHGIPVIRQTFGEVVGLPDPEQDTYFIVSRLVAQAIPLRTDLLVPSQLYRDADGVVVGCLAFESV